MARGKQRGKKMSQNLQFVNCKNVNIRKIENAHGKNATNPNDNQKDERGDDVMLNITFKRSSSPNMEMAVVIVNKLGGNYDGSRCILMIPDSQIPKNLKQLLNLARIIDQWKLVNVTFRDREVNLYKFLMGVKRSIDCSKDYSDYKHCYQSLNHEGWGCKYLSKIKHHILPGARKSGNYWYNYGYFTGDNEWTINKDLIRHILTTEVRKRGLDLCPFFDFKILTERINSLPDTITVDGKFFEKVWEMDYNVHPAKLKPVNIRHIPVLTPDEEIEVKTNEMVKVLEKQIKEGGLSEEEMQKRIDLLQIIKKEPPAQDSQEVPFVELMPYYFSDN